MTVTRSAVERRATKLPRQSQCWHQRSCVLQRVWQGKAGKGHAYQSHGCGGCRHQRRRPTSLHKQLGEGATPGQEAKRFVEVADREVAGLPPAENQLGCEQQVGQGHQQSNKCCSRLARRRPEGQRHGEQEQEEPGKAEAGDEFKRRVQHTISQGHVILTRQVSGWPVSTTNHPQPETKPQGATPPGQEEGCLSPPGS